MYLCNSFSSRKKQNFLGYLVRKSEIFAVSGIERFVSNHSP